MFHLISNLQYRFEHIPLQFSLRTYCTYLLAHSELTVCKLPNCCQSSSISALFQHLHYKVITFIMLDSVYGLCGLIKAPTTYKISQLVMDVCACVCVHVCLSCCLLMMCCLAAAKILDIPQRISVALGQTHGRTPRPQCVQHLHTHTHTHTGTNTQVIKC